ncbi:MAG TPA: 50S ribosomal protein L21 [Patescibacteria group bacterium]|nr:50S ribosomal protein L21 [Patescibacteria group bacterium]
MFAIVEIAAQQFKVQQSDVINVPLLKGNVGDAVEFGNIILAGDGDNLSIGLPNVKGSVHGEIVAHGKADKVLVFHKKRRKGYQKLNGHRQNYTRIKITDIKL